MRRPKPSAPPSEPRSPSALPFGLCVGAGLLLSTLPHLLWWARRGEPVWFADYDELSLYLPIISQAYYNHPFRLGDPTQAEGGATLFPWLQMAPAVLIARGLGLGMTSIGLIWRIWAGLAVGAGWYLALRRPARGSWIAAALALLLMTDGGILSGLPVLRQASHALALTTGPGYERLTATIPILCLQWRLITPGLSLPFLLLQAWLLARALSRPDDRAALALAACGFGLLFYVYFYYWTAAGLALLLCMVLDPSRRRVYFLTGLIGTILGAPMVLAQAWLKQSTSDDWLMRSDKFVQIPRFSELNLHPSLYLILPALAWILLRRRRDLTYLWALAAAGWLLTNHQVVSGLQIENFHWDYVRGPALAALLLLIAVDELPRWVRPRAAAALLGLVCVAQFGLSAGLRAIEALESRSSREIMKEYEAYLEQRRRPDAPRFGPRAVLAGDQGFVDPAVALENVRPLEQYSVLFSPAVGNDEWDARIALNEYLADQDRERFVDRQRRYLGSRDQRSAVKGGVWGPWRRDAAALEARVRARLEAFDAVRADPAGALERFAVAYIILSADKSLPAQLDVAWSPIQDGPHWRIWERGNAGPTGVEAVE